MRSDATAGALVSPHLRLIPKPTENNPTQDLIARWQAFLGLHGESTGACDNDGKRCKADLNTNEYSGDIISWWRVLRLPGEVGQDKILKYEIENAHDDH